MRPGLLLSLLLVMRLSAQPYLVKDITTNPAPVSSSPAFLGIAGGVTYFAPAPTGNKNQRTLWKTDGTAAGTVEVSAAVHPIPPTSESDPTATLGNRLFFRGDDGTGQQLFVTDGTAPGTVRLTSTRRGFDIHGLFSDGSRVYFPDTDDPSGSEPWVSDGTLSGTHMLSDIEAGTPSSDPIFLGRIGSDVIFSGYHNGSRTLFRTNGTKQGTVAFAISAAMAGVTLGNRVVIAAMTDDFQSWNLQITDGTAAGTMTLKTFKGYPPTKLGTMKGDRLFFHGTDASGSSLWVTDGTIAGTQPFEIPGAGWPTVVGNDLYYFTATTSSTRYDLWKTDGTVAGTKVVKADVSWGPYDVTALGGFFYFCDNGALFMTDGTSVTKVDHLPGDGAGLTNFIAPTGGSLLFSFADATHGAELWSTDGTTATAHLLANIASDKTAGTTFSGMRPLGNRVMFVAKSGDQVQLWRSDGTSGGTQALANLPAETDPYPVSIVVNGIYFVSSVNSIWRSDGTAAGTFKLPVTSSPATNLSKFRNGIMFTGCVNTVCGAWTSDGTAAGTHAVGNGTAIFGSNGVEIGNELWFAGAGGNAWRTDGTSFSVVGGSGHVTSPSFTAFGGYVYFMSGNDLLKSDGSSPDKIATLPVGGQAYIVRTGSKLLILARGNLWTSDGTTVTKVADGFFEPCGGNYIVDGEVLYFMSTLDYGGRDGLWRTDGTTAGTYLAAPFSTVDCQLFNYGRWSYVVAGDARNVGNVWATDKTAGQTFRVTNVNGPSSAPSYGFALAGSTLFFTADDLLHGIELWALPLVDAHRRSAR